MFNFFNKNKEYISCKHLEYGIHFECKGLFYCGFYSHSNQNSIPVVKLSDDLNENIKQLIKIREKDKKSFKSGKIINRCKDCFMLEKKVWEKSSKIKTMDISANRACNSDCMYCTSHANKKYYNSVPDLPIYSILEELISKNLIDKNLEVHWGGGEPTLLKEFPQIMDLFLDKLEPMLRIYSSGIKYSTHIEKALKLGRCTLVVSLDSGNPDLYKKIKNVDEFTTVVDNLKNYCKAQDELPERKYVILKYILIPGVNDTEEYIYEFLTVAKNINCQEVRCDLEQEWYKRNKNNFDLVSSLFHKMKYFDIQAKKMGLVHFFNVVPFRLIEMYTEEVYESIKIDENVIK